ncbi:replication protein A 70 kDa DNA-binding subunit-like [Corythoichthys intestinalis]|uniref:replication protein A 70 kDa DNA-binding subunit-like n=1 Tax=Corythoichthys intestinalis TaxID=161448 RepID=UPI0025A60CDE|nr:replication protein A 70 kDa DNA-binding subunit-like [Corythoichthys intestinalis]
MNFRLTEGAIESLFKEIPVKNPVLQLMNIRECPPGKQGQSRYRLNLSDGVHSSSCFVLASQLNHLSEDKQLEPNCVCVLKKTISSNVASKQVLVVLEMDVLQTAAAAGGKIGNPIQLIDTAGQEEAARSTNSSNEIPGPSRTSTSSCENSPMKISQMKGTGKAATLKSFGTEFTPINKLNPYLSNWTIRVRVTHKSDIRNWSNSRGDGKLFSFDVTDQSGEIRITAFNIQVDKFFSLVEPNEVYLISKGSLKLANKQFATLNNEYEITLCANSCVLPCKDGWDVPSARCNFVPISALEDKDPDASPIIDVIGVCQEAEEVSQITTKAGKQLTKRELALIDSSGKMVTLTLWGDQAQKFNASCHPVVAIKGARLSTFGGRSLTAVYGSTLMVNPEIPEAYKLRYWYNQVGYAHNVRSLTDSRSTAGEFTTNWKSLSDVKTQQLGHGEKADFFSCVATVVFARKENCLYKACPAASCHKKVHQQENGRFRCDKCCKDYPGFKYRFMLSVNLADFGDNMWATCFQETAETLLGLSAEQLGELRDTDETAFNEVFRKVHFSTHVFRNRVKLETYNDECRIKVTVLEVLPVDHRQHSRNLLNSIRTLAQRN